MERGSESARVFRENLKRLAPAVITGLLASAVIIVSVIMAIARDDGRYANEPLHAWFDQLASGKGLCCSFADGFSVQDVDWDTGGGTGEGGVDCTGSQPANTPTPCSYGRYRVRLHGQWIVVPDSAAFPAMRI